MVQSKERLMLDKEEGIAQRMFFKARRDEFSFFNPLCLLENEIMVIEKENKRKVHYKFSHFPS